MKNTIYDKKVKKVIIPAAGWGTRMLPATKSVPKEMLPIVDKPIAHFLVEEAAAAGIEEVIFITADHKHALENYFNPNLELEGTLKGSAKWELLKKAIEAQNLVKKVTFIVQEEAKGLGHAIGLAKDYVGNEPVAVILGDDAIINEDGATPISQLIKAYEETGRTIIGVQQVAKKDLSKYGIVAFEEQFNKKIDGLNVKFMDMQKFVEKPNPEDAPSRYAALGRYVITPDVMEFIVNEVPSKVNGEIQLTDSVEKSLKQAKTYAVTFEGTRYDCGSKTGYVKAIIDTALKHPETAKDIAKYIESLNKK